ncbi:MAG: alanine racemase [Candidatus Latescibacteria bacterium]|jgi:alanine racemase|nr:alanine racemase [Candidatus Latescibacterota bacterium]MBT4139188.1 alanine racemase [Candidatus Latescibacterota bacterium]MBT5831980.1 alanine racemase [Candidatus Latescibacterota bacterium]
MPVQDRSAWIEVDLNAISKNITAIQNFVGPQTHVMAVVKANAYGHGLIEVSKAALQGGANFLGVALPQEGQQLREAGIPSPILVLGPCLPSDAPTLIKNNLATVISHPKSLQELASIAKAQKTQARIHLKIDTGMGRVGCTVEDGLSLAHTITSDPHLHLEGVMSHVAYENEQDHPKILDQINLFQSFLKQQKLPPIPYQHLANSATTLQFPQAHHNLVRVGLLTYGLPPVNTQLHQIPALSLKAHITQIRNLQPGQTLSYGGTFTLKRASRIALIPLGYADGYSRGLSNRAQVLVQGQRCPVVGSICMDLTLIDVTDLPHVTLGDEVVLIGPSKDDRITPQDLATWSETIVHEIIAQLSTRLPRRYLPT